MLQFLSLPVKALYLLRSNTSDREIAFGACLGMFFGFLPLNGPITLLFVLFFFVFKINRVATLLTLPLFKIIYLLGARYACAKIGAVLLIDASFLSGLWAFITNLPVVALLGLNYTVVAGGLVLSGLLSPAVFFISRRLVISLRGRYGEWTKKSRLVSKLSASAPLRKIGSLVDSTAFASMKQMEEKRALWITVRELFMKRKTHAAPKNILSRINIKGIAIVLVALFALHLLIGFVVSPFAAASVIRLLNEKTGSKISAGRVMLWPLTLSVSMADVRVFSPNREDARIAKFDKFSFSLSPVGLLSARVIINDASMSGMSLTPSGVADSSFVPPKGLIETAVVPAEKSPWDLASVLKSADKNKDLAGKVWQIVKQNFSKSAAKRAQEAKRSSKKVTKTVEEFYIGQRVDFRRGAGRYLLQIRSIGIENGFIEMNDEKGRAIAVGGAHIKIGGLLYDPVYGVDLGNFSIKGKIEKDGAAIGSLETGFSKTVTASSQRGRFNITLKDVDLAAGRVLYDKSLPVYAERGSLDLISRTSIDEGEMDSRNRIVLKGQKVVARRAGEVIFGVMPVDVLCEAMNAVDPLTIKFDISGDIEHPRMKGLEDSLMALAKPYLEKVVKEKVVKEGQRLLKSFLDKSLKQ